MSEVLMLYLQATVIFQFNIALKDWIPVICRKAWLSCEFRCLVFSSFVKAPSSYMLTKMIQTLIKSNKMYVVI